jgi:tetratricopeptide (TPR) repeat protein
MGVALLVCAIDPIHHACAQSDAGPSDEYEAEIGAAVDEHEAGRFEAARGHFLRAHGVFPNARTLRGLGKVEFELGNYVAAYEYLQAALESPVRPLPDDLRSESAALVERAREHVGEVTLDVKPDTAQLTVDGIAVASGAHTKLVLAEGEHVLELRAPGRLTERRQLAVHAHDQLQLAVALSAPEASTPAVQLDPAPIHHDVPAHRKWWVWTVSGMALAGTVTAAVLLATRDRDRGTGSAWTLEQP